jgi:hypothetical protein
MSYLNDVRVPARPPSLKPPTDLSELPPLPDLPAGFDPQVLIGIVGYLQTVVDLRMEEWLSALQAKSER